MTTNGGAHSTSSESATAEEVFDGLGDQELAVVRALDGSTRALDDAELASAARLTVSTARSALQTLEKLGLVEADADDEGRARFRLIRERVRAQIEEAPAALFTSSV